VKPAALEDNHWMEDAIATIVGIANSQDFLTADDLRAHLRPAPVANWTGLAFTSAKRAGIIEPLGYQTSTSKTRRHGALRTWRRVSEGASK
jgi:hypothetical protein